ncbi:MAG: membrane protein insertion efficiency factor YidD [Spirochaetaceae bacterium]|nr:membrane protein insertion efficiency factor YidD [Spirochaetaceae bacterium]
MSADILPLNKVRFNVLQTDKENLVISLIRLYQSKAPAELRASCRFEPSCSNYMILAIQKYGTFSGIMKGLHRIIRCHYPNGGIDYP